MATKKKAKKKAAPRKVRKVSTDSVLVFELLTRLEGMVRSLVLDQTALREAIERLDRDVAKLDAEAFRQLVELVRINLNPTAPAAASVAVAGEATAGADVPLASVTVVSEPTDAELLS